MLELVPASTVTLVLQAQSGGHLKLATPNDPVLLTIVPFVSGGGNATEISGDQDNIAVFGTDGGIYVPAPSFTTEHW